MPRSDRVNLAAVEVSISQADYLKQKYGVRTRTEAIRLALDDFCKIPDLSDALNYDHDKCLAVSDETKVRLMQALNYPDWRFAALHIISDFLYNHYARVELNKTDTTSTESQEDSNV